MKDSSAYPAKPVRLGRVSGVFGVRGWVRIFSYTDPREGILDYADCLLQRDDGWQPARIEEGKPHGKSIIARFAGVDDRDAALALAGADIAIDREALADPAPHEYYWADLEGLEVRHRGKRTLGRVAYLVETGAHDVLVVQGEGGQEILIPFVTEKVVLAVDLAKGTIDVDWEWD